MESKFVIEQDHKIHYVDCNSMETDRHSMLIVPGLSENTEDYLELANNLKRRVIVMDLRGRGKSSSPAKGYTLEDHISDIYRVVEQENLKEFVLLGYSRGVSYTLGFALSLPQRVKGLILGDYPAMHSKLPTGWADWMIQQSAWRGKEPLERMKSHVYYALETDSKEILFWDQLDKLDCPTLVIRGGREGSLLSDRDLTKYKESIPHVDIYTREECDHNIWEPNRQKIEKMIKDFLHKHRL